MGRGGAIYRKRHLSRKISMIEVRSGDHGVSQFKLGHKRPNKKGFGSEIFWARPRGPQSLAARKFEYLKIRIFLL